MAAMTTGDAAQAGSPGAGVWSPSLRRWVGPWAITLPMAEIPESHMWLKKKPKKHAILHRCLQQHHSQQLRGGNNLSAH